MRTYRSGIGVAVCLSYLILGVSAAMAVQPIGRVIAVQGSVTAIGVDDVSRTMELKSSIFLNDRVITETSSKIQILFDDESVISQGEKSEMTIDEYIYSPSKKKKNRCSIRLLSGLFRVITGKITKLNPERFNVKTRMATIGIRGCDLGFTITKTEEKIYVFAFHFGESVVVEAKAPGGGEWSALIDGKSKDLDSTKRHLVNVLKPNRVVSITQGVGIEKREITRSELMQLILNVTPGVDVPLDSDAESGPVSEVETDGGPAGTQDADSGTALEQDSETDEVAMLDPTGTDPTATDPLATEPLTTDTQPVDNWQLDENALPSLVDTFQIQPLPPPPPPIIHTDPIIANVKNTEVNDGHSTSDGDNGDGTTPLLLEPIGTLVTDTGEISDYDLVSVSSYADLSSVYGDTTEYILTVDNTPVATVDSTTPTDSLDGSIPADPIPGGGGTGDTGGGTTTPPPGPTASFVAMGAGTDWDWGRWELDGLLDSVAVRSSSVLSAANYQSIANGAAMYNLSGAGEAGAVIQNAGSKKLVSGSANLNVSVGQGRVPTWIWIFDMRNSVGDILYSEGNGSISPAGNMTGSTTVYSMKVNGTSFGKNSITAENINGNLVGPGTGAKPITGAIGTFNFAHGSAATVNGVFGADLN